MILNLKTDNQNINEDFKRIATELMNYWLIKIEGFRYRIVEIEFYLKSQTHPDKYTHGHVQQKKPGCWYFHGSGVDITFGDENSYGGILIRAIYDIDNTKYTYGPINVITELCSHIQSVNNTSFFFGLISAPDNIFKIEKPIAAPRVGLNKTKDPEMQNKLYRFLVMPKEAHAEKTKIAEAMKNQNYSEDEIKSIWK
jgi:hypothetical protein